MAISLHKIIFPCLTTIVLLLTLHNPVCLSQSREYTQIKVCFNKINVKDLAKSIVTSDGYQSLRLQLNSANCTHIVGGLVLANLAPSKNGSDPDFSMLHNIQEVSDFIYVKNVSVRRIDFPKLRIIRGQSLINVGNYSDAALVVVDNPFISLHGGKFKSVLEVLSFPLLTSIQRGNVVAKDNNGLCFFPHKVNWTLIMDDPDTYKVLTNQNSTRDHSWCNYNDESGQSFVCDPTCKSYNGIKYCFSREPKDCQINTKCLKRSCTHRCYFDEKNEEECCNQQCAAGCTGAGENQCYACQYSLNDNSCVHSCPKRTISQGNRVVPNPLFKFTLGPYCVTNCPSAFTIEEDYCVVECSKEDQFPTNGECKTCRGSNCPKKCDLDEIKAKVKSSSSSLDRRQLMQLVNCTHLKGDIIINQFTLDGDMMNQDHEPVTNLQDFETLSSLREITGRLQVIGSQKPNILLNLQFLRNLEKIKGEFLNDPPMPHSLLIAQTISLEYLGLKSLKIFGLPSSPAGLINLPVLCYLPFEFINRTLQQNGQSPLRMKRVKSSIACEKEGKVCDANCNEEGCWGPGPELCVACRLFNAGGVCTSNCSLVPGFFFNATSNTCQPCHEQCARGCWGPQDNQCTDGCRNARENGRCVLECSRWSYLEESSQECRACNGNCSMSAEVGRVCTGPSPYPGPGGCSKCSFIELDSNKEMQQCVSGCQAGYFHDSIRLRRPEERFKVQVQGDIFWACSPCPALCPLCTRSSTDRSTCLKCLGFWLDDKCVPGCPIDRVFKLDKEANGENKCVMCHSECSKNCHGTTAFDCLECRNLRIYINDTNFYCNHTCPPDRPEQLRDDKEGFHYCLSQEEKDKIVQKGKILLGGMVGAGSFILLIFVAVITIVYCCRKKAEEEKLLEQLKNAMSDKDAPDYKALEECNEGREPDMGRLIMVNFDDLEFEDKSHPLGSGAFGCVYKGFWYIPKDETAKMTKEKRRVWLPVAIKVIEGTAFHGDTTEELRSISEASLADILNEIRVMASVEHKHCLRLFGFCICQGSYYLLSAYRPLGSMDRYLSQHQYQLSSYTLLLWASQIADGMAYLEMRNIIHRDLATRNVLIVDEGMVQITDFGLAKMITDRNEQEIIVRQGRVPIRWLAIETLREGRYSHATDVWSYGVTLWEIFSFGQRPYADVETVDIKDHVEKGGRLSQPDICTLDVYMVMVKCWMEEAVARPTFQELLKTFQAFSQNPGRYLFIQNDPYKLGHKDTDGMEMTETPLLCSKANNFGNNHHNYQNTGPSRLPYTEVMDGDYRGELQQQHSPMRLGGLQDDAGYMMPSLSGYGDPSDLPLLPPRDSLKSPTEPLLPKRPDNFTPHSSAFKFPHLGFNGGRNNNNNDNTAAATSKSNTPAATGSLLKSSEPLLPRPMQQKFVSSLGNAHLRSAGSQDHLRYCDDPTNGGFRKLPQSAVPSFSTVLLPPPPALLANDDYIPSQLGIAPTTPLFLPHSSTSEDEGYLEALTGLNSSISTVKDGSTAAVGVGGGRNRLTTESASSMKYADLESLADEGYEVSSTTPQQPHQQQPGHLSYLKNNAQTAVAAGNQMYFPGNNVYLQQTRPEVAVGGDAAAGNFYMELQPSSAQTPSDNYINPCV